jgi:hypothetical protein
VYNTICWAVATFDVSFMAWVWIFCVKDASQVLEIVLDAILGRVAAVSIAVVDCDMVVAMGRQGFETRG